jgi:hypothetical protein
MLSFKIISSAALCLVLLVPYTADAQSRDSGSAKVIQLKAWSTSLLAILDKNSECAKFANHFHIETKFPNYDVTSALAISSFASNYTVNIRYVCSGGANNGHPVVQGFRVSK